MKINIIVGKKGEYVVMKQNIAIIGTGGTIAGKGASDTDLTGYTPGVITVEEIIESVPGVSEYGPFVHYQFANMESSDITMYQWIELAKLVQSVVDREDVGGVVITHGTDTLEETAYFLNLVVHTDKPIVVTGSMRPASAISADGPINLLQSIQVTRHPSSVGKGVLVVLNGTIESAREVTKMNTTNVSTFGSPNTGHMGFVQDGVPHFYSSPVRRHTLHSEFAVADTLPHVPILACYAGIEESVGAAVLNTHPDGLVIMGLGHGTVPKQIRVVTEKAGVPVVRASRTGTGIVSALSTDKGTDYIVSDSLSPQKARILLMVALQKERTKGDLERIFKEY